MVRPRLAAGLALCFAVFAAATATSPAMAGGAARSDEVKVILDRAVVSHNETFKVRFTTAAGNAADPDWSPLQKNFHLRSKSQKLRQTTVNGVSRALREWSVQLQPRRAGQLTIPPLKFGAVRSRATPLQVKPRPPQPTRGGRAGEEFFIEVSAQPESPYVQAQVLFTLRVFMLHGLRGSVSPPQSSNKAIVENLGNARRYRTQRGGGNYEVYERRYLIYPQNSGKVVIKPVAITGSYVKQGRRFSVKKRSRPVTLKVRQVPASFPGKFWLPAENFKIEENWSADLSAWRAGEPVTRTLGLRANGLLAKQVPEVDLSVGDGFRFYTESADFKNERRGNTSVGRRLQSVVLIPAQPGTYTLPAVEVPWWNTRTDRLEFARLPAQDVTVGEAAFSELTVDEPPPAVAADEVERESAVVAAAGGGAPWFWVSAVLLLGWLATTAVMWRGEGVYRLLRAARRRRETLRERRGAIRQACRDNDAAAARDALMQWARQMWPDDTPTSLAQVGARYSGMGGGMVGGVVAQQILRLERALYARDDKWQGALLWDALSETFASRGFAARDKRQARRDGLEPLHRL